MSSDMLQVAQDRVTEKLNAAAQASGQPMKAIDPAVWAGILSTALNIILECQKKRAAEGAPPAVASQKVAKALANPTMVQKLVVRSKMIREVGRRKWRENGDEIHEKLMAVNIEATDDERLALVDQVVASR